jgi:DNA-binding response OmpR family regulator
MTILTCVQEPARDARRSDRFEVERSTRILVVEDEPLTAEVFARALARHGFVVQVAGDGLQALRLVRERPPSLVVLDISLPVISGVEVARELRTAALELPIVVVSGSSQQQTSLSAVDLHPGAWLAKPIKPRALVAAVRDLLQRHDGGLPPAD